MAKVVFVKVEDGEHVTVRRPVPEGPTWVRKGDGEAVYAVAPADLKGEELLSWIRGGGR